MSSEFQSLQPTSEEGSQTDPPQPGSEPTKAAKWQRSDWRIKTPRTKPDQHLHRRQSSTTSQQSTWGGMQSSESHRSAYPILCWNDVNCRNIDSCVFVHPNDPEYEKASEIFDAERYRLKHLHSRSSMIGKRNDGDMPRSYHGSVASDDHSEAGSVNTTITRTSSKAGQAENDLQSTTSSRCSSPFESQSNAQMPAADRTSSPANSHTSTPRQFMSTQYRHPSTRRDASHASLGVGFGGIYNRQLPANNMTAQSSFSPIAQYIPLNSSRRYFPRFAHLNSHQQRSSWPAGPPPSLNRGVRERRRSSASIYAQQYVLEDGMFLGAGSPYYPRSENTDEIKATLRRQILYSKMEPQFCGSPRNRGPNVVFLKRFKNSQTMNIYASLTQSDNIEFWVWDMEWESEYYFPKAKPKNLTSLAGEILEDDTGTSVDPEERQSDSNTADVVVEGVNDTINVPQSSSINTTKSPLVGNTVETALEDEVHSNPSESTSFREDFPQASPSSTSHNDNNNSEVCSLDDTLEKISQPTSPPPENNIPVTFSSGTPTSSAMESLASRETSSNYSVSSYETDAQKKDRYIREFKSQLLVSISREREQDGESVSYDEISNTLKSLTAELFQATQGVRSSRRNITPAENRSYPGSIAEFNWKNGNNTTDKKNEGYLLLDRLGLLQDERVVEKILPDILDTRTLREKLDDAILLSTDELSLWNSQRKATNRVFSLLDCISAETETLRAHKLARATSTISRLPRITLKYDYGDQVLDFGRATNAFENALKSERITSTDLMTLLRTPRRHLEVIKINESFPFKDHHDPLFEFPPGHWLPSVETITPQIQDHWDTVDLVRTYSMTLSCQRNLTVLFRQCGSQNFVKDWCSNMDPSHRHNLIVRAFTSACIALDWDGAVYMNATNLQDWLKKQKQAPSEYWTHWIKRQNELENMIGNTEYKESGQQNFVTTGMPPTELASDVGILRIPVGPPPFSGYKSTLQSRSLFCTELSDPALSTDVLSVPRLLEKLCLFNGSGTNDHENPAWLPKETPPGDLSAEIARYKMPKLLDFPSTLFGELWKIKGRYYFNRLAERVTADRTLFMSAWAVHLLLQYWQASRTRIFWNLDPNVLWSKETETGSTGNDVEDDNRIENENEGPSTAKIAVPHEASSAEFNMDHACADLSPSQDKDLNKTLDLSIDKSFAEERCKTPRQTSPSIHNEEEIIGSVKELWQWCDKNRIPVEFICINECREGDDNGKED